MRLFMIFSVPLATFFAVVYIYKPEIIEKEYRHAVAPIESYFAEKRAAVWQKAKEQAWQERPAKIHLPSDCAHPASAIRKMECDNLWQLEANWFERTWATKISNGWKPEGIN